MSRRWIGPAMLLVGALPAQDPDLGARAPDPHAPDVREGVVQFATSADRVRVEVLGRHFTDYWIAGQPQPVLWPIVGPGGVHVTRDFPLTDDPELLAGEAKDHPHHRSLWFAHGSVNGVDFWHTVPGKGRIEHAGFLAPEAEHGFRTANRWMHGETVVCTDERAMSFGTAGTPGEDDFGVFVDVAVTLIASEGELALGDTKEGTFGLRLHPALRLRGEVAAGAIRNSAGDVDGEAWGKRAAWVDYSGVVEGQRLGVAVFDHPQNLRHPTYWHARDYGLVAANPFGVHDFVGAKGGAEAGAGDWVLAAGERRTFRYRVWIHSGLPVSAGAEDPVAAQWRRWAAR